MKMFRLYMRTIPLFCKNKTNETSVRTQVMDLVSKDINDTKAAQLAEILHLWTELEESRLD